MKIHFCLFQNFPRYSKILNITQARSYLKKKNILPLISYKFIETTKEYINQIEPGKRVTDLPDLDHIIRLINNKYEHRDLLDGIPINDEYRKILKQITINYANRIDADCICFTAFSPFVFLILYATFIIKKYNPDIHIMIGGIQMDLSKTTFDIFNNIPEVNFAVSGDLELALEEYINGTLKSGFVGNVNMKELEPPIFYTPEIMMENNLLVNTSRSCPYKCSFCSGTSVGKFRYMRTSKVIETIHNINKMKKYNPHIYFTDNTFNFTRKRIYDICNGINNKIPLTAYLVYDNLDFDMIRTLKESNFHTLRLGLDAFATEKRIEANKSANITKDQLFDLANETAKHDIIHQIYLIFCMPNESEESFQIDFEIAKELAKIYKVEVFTFLYTLSVGSDMYNNPKKYGIKYEYWDLNCVIPEINKSINECPKYYYCSVSQKEYINRFMRLKPIMREEKGYKSTILEMEKYVKQS